MYRNGDDYERIDQAARDILVDYGIKKFPLDLFSLAKRMGFELIPYSAFEGNEDSYILQRKSMDGFSIPASCGAAPVILYNDKVHVPPARLQSTIGHEIKHIIDGDVDDSQDDLCDHFARYIRCPTPYVIYMGYKSSQQLIDVFGISAIQADITINTIKSRSNKYGQLIFQNEVELMEQLCPGFKQEKEFN